jgi:glycosidase
MLLLSLRGTPTLYYGDEIGMADVAIPPEQVQDPWEKNCAAMRGWLLNSSRSQGVLLWLFIRVLSLAVIFRFV